MKILFFLKILLMICINNICYATNNNLQCNNTYPINIQNTTKLFDLHNQILFNTNYNKIQNINNYQQLFNSNINNKIYKFHQSYDSIILNHKNYNNFRIQLENDSFYTLHILNKYLKSFFYDEIFSFAQLGIQNFLSKKNIIFGIGKRYVYDNQNIIGYHTLLHYPLNNQFRQPYSINVGGEYRCNDITITINNYYNLHRIIHHNKKKCINCFMNPIIGYQIRTQTKLPYTSNYTSYIKYEKFFYKKRHNKSLNFNNNKDTLSLGIGYKPIPILEIEIDNIFNHSKYINTLCTVALHYQFSVPIINQINNEYYKNQYSNLNNLNSIIKPFNPNFSGSETTYNYDNDNNPQFCQSIQEIIGYPGEIKTIKINGNKSFVNWDLALFHKYGGKITYLQNNTYLIHLPKYFISRKNQVFLSYDIKTHMHSKPLKTQKLLIIVQNYPTKSESLLNTNTNDPTIITENNQKTLFNSDPQNISINKFDLHTNVDYYHDHICRHNSTGYTDDNLIGAQNSNNSSIDISFPPPPPPDLPIFIEAQQSASDNIPDLSFTSGLNISTDKTTDNYSVSGYLDNTGNFIENDNNSVDSALNVNSENLSSRLSIHKQSKFSSIGTTEYIEKLEKNIMERKKDKCVSDMEKILNKLHITASQSSLEESLATDDSDNDFQIKANN